MTCLYTKNKLRTIDEKVTKSAFSGESDDEGIFVAFALICREFHGLSEYDLLFQNVSL